MLTCSTSVLLGVDEKKDVHGSGSRKRHKAYWKTTKCPLQMGPIQNQ